MLAITSHLSSTTISLGPALKCSQQLRPKIEWKHQTRPVIISCQAVDSEETDNTAETQTEEFPGFSSFLESNGGNWRGLYKQFNFSGETMHSVQTEVKSQVDGQGNGAILNQTLHVLQAQSKTREPGEKEEEVWRNIPLANINRLTAQRTQQLSYFEESGAYALSHQTAEVIDKVLRIGVLGPDDEEEEFPNGVKLPTNRPALVTEMCLFSRNKDERIRAFQILDPRGVIDTIGFFHEFQSQESSFELKERPLSVDDLLGEWTGIGLVQRSPLYGGSMVEQETSVVCTLEDDGNFFQRLNVNIGGSIRSMTSVASVSGSLLLFKGLQTLLLPGGVALTCPSVVARGQAFAFECMWMVSSNERQRLQRTYDTDGMVVSNAHFLETKS